MKTIYLFLLVLICLGGTKTWADEQNKAPLQNAQADVIAAFQASPSWNKLDQTTQNAWLSAMTSGDTERRLDCFVRGKEFLDRGDQSFLISNGFNIRASTGYIARGYVSASDLPNVARQPFVATIRLSDPGN